MAQVYFFYVAMSMSLMRLRINIVLIRQVLSSCQWILLWSQEYTLPSVVRFKSHIPDIIRFQWLHSLLILRNKFQDIWISHHCLKECCPENTMGHIYSQSEKREAVMTIITAQIYLIKKIPVDIIEWMVLENVQRVNSYDEIELILLCPDLAPHQMTSYYRHPRIEMCCLSAAAHFQCLYPHLWVCCLRYYIAGCSNFSCDTFSLQWLWFMEHDLEPVYEATLVWWELNSIRVWASVHRP